MARKPPEFVAFETLTDHLLSVPREVVERRIAEHKAKAALNPYRRGPKPKKKISDGSRDRA